MLISETPKSLGGNLQRPPTLPSGPDSLVFMRCGLNDWAFGCSLCQQPQAFWAFSCCFHFYIAKGSLESLTRQRNRRHRNCHHHHLLVPHQQAGAILSYLAELHALSSRMCALPIRNASTVQASPTVPWSSCSRVLGRTKRSACNELRQSIRTASRRRLHRRVAGCSHGGPSSLAWPCINLTPSSASSRPLQTLGIRG